MGEVVVETVGQKAAVQLAWVEYKVVDALTVHAPSVGQGSLEGWHTLQ